MANAVTSGTKSAYHRSWARFRDFAEQHSLDTTLPLTVSAVALFIADRVQQKYKASTISAQISALGYIHKLRGLADPTASFLIQKMLVSCHKQQPTQDMRLPIDKAMLSQILAALEHTTTSSQDRSLFRAMFALAFHAFLRIGEITVSSPGVNNPNLLELKQIEFNSTESCCITFIKYKHSKSQSVTVTVKAGQPGACPVRIMKEYVAVRGARPGPLFLRTPGILTPVTRSQFNAHLRSTLIFCKFATARFTSHSFRIGAATSAAAQGLSDAQIRQLGRWNSDAFKKYIRNSTRSSAL